MKNKIIVGLIIAVVIAVAAISFSNTSLFKGSLTGVTKSGAPFLTQSPSLATNAILQATQDIALFDVSVPQNSSDIELLNLTLQCVGNGADNVGLVDNYLEIKEAGSLVAFSLEGAGDCQKGITVKFPPNIGVIKGTTKSFLIRFDTSANTGQWAVNETLQFIVPQNGLKWNFVNTRPKTNISNSYPVGGPVFTF